MTTPHILLSILTICAAGLYLTAIGCCLSLLNPVQDDEPDEMPDGQPDFTLDDLDWSEEYE